MMGAMPGVLTKNTSSKVVLPFYLYATASFLAACALLFTSAPAFTQHHFHPQTLAITHIMALGWGTMMILGASHQLVPVFIEGKLYSEKFAYLTFVLAGTGIPLLVTAFYRFTFNWMAQAGGILVCLGIIVFLINLIASMSRSKTENVHALYILTATLWLLITALMGLFLVFNFTHNLLAFDSLHYLPLHAHLGIGGWFLLLIFGVAARLIPMFLISKYDNKGLLKTIFWFINAALILFILFFQYFQNQAGLQMIPVLLIIAALGMFLRFCRLAYKNRLRKKVDEQVTLSLLSMAMAAIPLVLLAGILLSFLFVPPAAPVIITYGFCIFFGWITAIILGMSFKTLPFILWNKKYSALAGKGKTPSPKDLFSDRLFRLMAFFYLLGFLMFCGGALFKSLLIIRIASASLLICAIFYVSNVLKMFFVTPLKSQAK